MHLPTVLVGQPFRIFIVEDDPAIVKLAALPLKNAGFAIFVARDGLEAWNQLLQIDPHLILTDIKMPNLSGPELVLRVRQASAIPIVLMTAHDSDEAQVKGLKIGADDYIAKPFTPHLLIMRIAASLRRVYRYNGPPAESMTTRSFVNAPTATTDALPRGFVRCDSCSYVGPAWKFEKQTPQGNMVTMCPHCSNKEITFALG